MALQLLDSGWALSPLVRDPLHFVSGVSCAVAVETQSLFCLTYMRGRLPRPGKGSCAMGHPASCGTYPQSSCPLKQLSSRCHIGAVAIFKQIHTCNVSSVSTDGLRAVGSFGLCQFIALWLYPHGMPILPSAATRKTGSVLVLPWRETARCFCITVWGNVCACNLLPCPIVLDLTTLVCLAPLVLHFVPVSFHA